ncbi:MAG: hypothetical protein HYW03_22225 [Deltaproteobacteria bacterium]|nr:hypothetical protein [Deltaproteobacteria bacterium]
MRIRRLTDQGTEDRPLLQGQQRFTLLYSANPRKAEIRAQPLDFLELRLHLLLLHRINLKQSGQLRLSEADISFVPDRLALKTAPEFCKAPHLVKGQL